MRLQAGLPRLFNIKESLIDLTELFASIKRACSDFVHNEKERGKNKINEKNSSAGCGRQNYRGSSK